MQLFLAVKDYQETSVQLQHDMTTIINFRGYVTLPCSQRVPRDEHTIATWYDNNNQPGRICDSSLQSKTTKG
eukprot:7689986-Ditylum_brightwellii.AAC.1